MEMDAGKLSADDESMLNDEHLMGSCLRDCHHWEANKLQSEVRLKTLKAGPKAPVVQVTG